MSLTDCFDELSVSLGLHTSRPKGEGAGDGCFGLEEFGSDVLGEEIREALIAADVMRGLCLLRWVYHCWSGSSRCRQIDVGGNVEEFLAQLEAHGAVGPLDDTAV